MRTLFKSPRAAFLASLLLTGCMVGPDYQQPSAPAPVTYKEQGPWKIAHPQDDALRGKWWEIYHDPLLNSLEEQVTISNQNVLVAEAQFRQAAAAVKAANSSLFPTVTSSPAFTESGRGGQNGNSSGIVTGGTGTDTGNGTGTVITSSGSSHGATSQSLYNLPVEVSYMADVWGGVRRNIEATANTAQASFADLENARLSYQATLAQDYFSLRGSDAEKDLLQDTVTSYQKYLDLTTNRYNAGISSQADVAQAKTQLDTAQVQLVDLGVQRAAYEHAIAILIGKPPSALALAEAPLPQAPPPVPVSLPSELLQRRPDIAGAERRVASANAAIGVQVAAYYPSITINATAGLESVELSQLFSGPSFFWSVGPELAQTIFDAGHIHSLVEEARANYDATVATYRQTVLTALQQVEDDLAALRILESEGAAADQASASARKSLDIATNQYKAGTEDYLNVITAQATALNDEISAISVRTRRMTTSVLLIEAMGGGWSNTKLPTENKVAKARTN